MSMRNEQSISVENDGKMIWIRQDEDLVMVDKHHDGVLYSILELYVNKIF